MAASTQIGLTPSWVWGVQGETGDDFFIIKQGEAVVFQETEQGLRKVNHLFKADFFGERALLTDEPRWGLCPPVDLQVAQGIGDCGCLCVRMLGRA